MAERFLFFNSAPTDPRKYQAQDFAEYFGSVLSSGLLHTDNVPGLKAAVEAGTLNTIVSPGKAVLRGHLYENTTPLTLAHDLPETSLDRIDRVVLRLNLNNAVRDIKLHVLTGVPAEVPVAPALTRTPFIYEISLAQVFVRKNTVQLLPTDLVDERLDEQLCGLVYSLISIPTDQLQAFITAKRTELNDEMNTALDAYLASLAAAEQKLQADLIAWNQQWTDWFTEIQGASFVTGAEFATHLAEKASLTQVGHTQLSSAVNSVDETLSATPKAVKQAYDRADAAFTSANNGKTAVANAVTAKGVAASPSDTFPVLATKIGQISTGKKWASGVTTSDAVGRIDIGGLAFKPSFIIVASSVRGQMIYNSLVSTTSYISYDTTIRDLNGDSEVISNGGFKLRTSPSVGTRTWIAFE